MSVSVLKFAIKPNVEKRAKTFRALSVFGLVLTILSFVGFGLCGALIVSRGKPEMFPLIVLPFSLFIIGGVLATVFFLRTNVCNFYANVIKEVKNNDYILIAKLAQARNMSETDCETVLSRLIDTQNLSDYEIVAHKVVAKKQLSFDVQRAEDEYSNFVSSQSDLSAPYVPPVECPHCGAPVSDPGARSCRYCGKRFD